MIRWAPNRGNPSSVLIMDTEAEVSEQIRWFTCTPGEEQGSWVNHYAYLESDLYTLVEALFVGVRQTTLDKYDQSETSWGLIIEHLEFTRDQHLLADGAARMLIGAPYHYIAIVNQALDGLFSKLTHRDIYLFRRIALPGMTITICSQLGVRVHKAAGWSWMGFKTVYEKIRKGWHIRIRTRQVLDVLPERRATPDDLFDDALEHRPSLYVVRGEINPHLRPLNLPGIIAAKIDSDLQLTT